MAAIGKLSLYQAKREFTKTAEPSGAGSVVHALRVSQGPERLCPHTEDTEMLDCLIIGGGPAGLLAAVYLGRYCRNVRVIDAGESRAAKIPESHNYPGFSGIGGIDLLLRLRAQAARYGVPVTSGCVISLRKESHTFVASSQGADLEAKFVMLATGLVDHCPSVEGGPDETCPFGAIRFCPICDGYEAIDRRIGVIGDLHSAGKKGLFLRTYTKDVSVFVTGDRTGTEDVQKATEYANLRMLDAPEKIKIDARGQIVILTETGSVHELDAIYPALGCSVRSELATVLGASCSDMGTLHVDDHQRTTVDGLYAAGDVVTDLHQLSVAFGHAAVAATDIHNRLPANYR
jgi:thioredoxin reductase (NADPH)